MGAARTSPSRSSPCSAPGGGGTTPLLDLVSLTLPGLGPAVVTGVAVVVVLGVLKRLPPGVANLAASLGRDGDLPRWFARGAEPGAVPRRGLVLTGVLGVAYLSVLLALGLDLEVFVLVHTSAMVAVYLLGTIAALRLLPRGSGGWWLALAAVVLVAGLVVLAGPNLGVAAVSEWRRSSWLSCVGPPPRPVSRRVEEGPP